jgi:predicted ATPase/DNA-binding winged helix-turn-helix (wHTH) protein
LANVTGASASHPSLTLTFGPFRLIPARGLLLEGERPCRLGSRAMEILLALVERAGETVPKQDLLARAWPGTFVDDANLRVHVAALRKVLGDGQGEARYIVNVMGRGYCFVAPVRRMDRAETLTPAPAPASHRHNLPAPLTRVLGRTDVIDAVALQVPARRLVTVTGPAGIGKTTVASAVGEKLLPVYDDGVWFIDLATVSDGQLIPFAIGSALGFSVTFPNPVPSAIDFLHDKRLLLVLDNCEHIVDAVAPLAESILRQAPHVGILATSRESLRAEGEWTYRLRPIDLPPESAPLTADEALQFAAVQLFVERASASLDGFQLTDADVAVVTDICRQLDGLPLAIELTATRIDMFGLRGLASVLNDHPMLLAQGHRTAQPRQQSLLGALDWSYRLLSPVEQTVLCRLAVFRGDFTLEAAIAVAAGDGISVDQIYAAVLTLSGKSLITTDVTGDAPQHYHRLLNVTRSFVDRMLRDSSDHERVVRRHAEYLCCLLEQAEADWGRMQRKPWLEIYGRSIDDIRAGLDWAFSPAGDARLGVSLTAAALPLGFQLALIDELRAWAERALLHARLIAPPLPLPEMRLNMAMVRLGHNAALPMPGRTPAFERALELSSHLDEPEQRAEPLIGQAAQRLASADYAAAAELVAQATAVARQSRDHQAMLGVDRIVAQSLHYNGDHVTAERVARQVLDHPAVQLPLTYHLMPVDRRISMRILLARVAWLRGFADQAVELAEQAIGFAAGDSAFSQCQAFALAAIPIALWRGDDGAATRMTDALAERANRFSLAYWQSWATAFRALLQARAGRLAGPPALAGALQLDTFCTFSVDHLAPMTILRADNGEAGWCEPEIHRARGEWLLSHGAPGAADSAEAQFRRALDVARRQEALAWELRAAISLARLWQGRSPQQAASVLSAVVQRFTEGHTTADLIAATNLLAELTAGRTIARVSAPRRESGRRNTHARNA